MSKTQAAAAAPAPTPAPKRRRIKVQATRMGFLDNKRYREGNVFTCFENEFSEVWMVKVAPATPEQVTTGQQDINRQVDEATRERREAAAAAGTGNADVLG